MGDGLERGDSVFTTPKTGLYTPKHCPKSQKHSHIGNTNDFDSISRYSGLF